MEAVNMIITSLKGDMIIIVNRFHIESAEQILSRGGSTVSGRHGDRGKPHYETQMASRDDRIG